MVEGMAVLDEGLDAAPVEGDGGGRSFPAAVADRTPREWRSLYERQHARADRERTRADAAEARCEDLRWAEVASRSDAGWWKSRFKACRRKLSAAEDETKELRRAARDVSSLRAEAARLEMLLSQAVGPSTGAGPIEALSKEVVRLRTALASSQACGDSAGEARRVRTALEEARQRKDAIGTLRKEVARLNKEVVRRDKAIARLNERLDRKKEETERIRETAKKLSGESLRLHREARILGDAEARSMLLSGEVLRLRHALDVSAAGQEKLKARLVKLRAAGATRSKLPFDEAAHLRTVLRRSRRRKATIESLSRENARLRKGAKTSRNRIETLEVQLERLRATGAVLSRSALRPQERAAGQAGLGTQARPAARRARPWPHPAARAR